MDSLLLQDWITVRGADKHTVIIQSEERWVEMSAFVDLLFWVQTSAIEANGGSMELHLQTAPSKIESAFADSDIVSPITVSAPAVEIKNGTLRLARLPASRWLRWMLFNSEPLGQWSLTFRIWVSFSRSGSQLWTTPAAPISGPSQERPQQDHSPEPKRAG